MARTIRRGNGREKVRRYWKEKRCRSGERQADIRFPERGRSDAHGYGLRRNACGENSIGKSEWPEQYDVGMDGSTCAVTGKKNDAEMGKGDRAVQRKRFDRMENERSGKK